MKTTRFFALAFLVLLIPTVAYGHWWRNGYQWWRNTPEPLPNDLCFSGTASGVTYCRIYSKASSGYYGRYGYRGHKGYRGHHGRWIKTDVCQVDGDFTATTQQDFQVAQADNGTNLTLCPLPLTGDGCSISIEFDGPLNINSYHYATYFKGSGVATVTSNGDNGNVDQIPVRVSGHIKQQGSGYRLWGNVFGFARLEVPLPDAVDGASETKYRAVKAVFQAQGERSDDPCLCDTVSPIDPCEDDTTSPTITCPADVMIQCDEDTSPDNTGFATVTDDCDATPVISFSDSVETGACPSTFTRTWTATDASGNSASCTQVITLEDTTAPVITCPPDTVADPGATDPILTGTATAVDNCDPNPVITSAEVQVPDPNNPNGFILTRTWTAIDVCGNSADCIQTITVTAPAPPVP